MAHYQRTATVMTSAGSLKPQTSRPPRAWWPPTPGRTVWRVTVRTGPLARSVMVYDQPATPDQARVSLRYCVAATLLRGRLDLTSFSAAGIADPAVADPERGIE